MSAIISDHYGQAVALFEAGRLDESLAHFEAFLKERPTSGKAWNGAGTVLFRQGQHEKAARYFERSLEQEDRPAEAWRNLICTWLVLGKPGKALRLLKTVDQESHADIALVCRTAAVLERQSDLAGAMSVLQFGRRLEGDTGMLSAHIDRLRARRARAAFFSGSGTGRLDAIVDYMQQRYPVRVYTGSDMAEIHQLMQWSDISWFEGFGDATMAGLSGARRCRTIVRMREDEGPDVQCPAVCLKNADVVVTTGTGTSAEAVRGLGQQAAIVTIPDGIDVEKIAFRRRRRGKKIAVTTGGAFETDIMRCVSELLRRDPGYEVRQAADWAGLEEISFIVSAGDSERARRTVLEAMASGVKPLVRNFPGAREIFGKNCLFSTPEEFCRMVFEGGYDSEAYRSVVELRCPLSRQLLLIDELFAGFEAAGARGRARFTEEILSSGLVAEAV